MRKLLFIALLTIPLFLIACSNEAEEEAKRQAVLRQLPAKHAAEAFTIAEQAIATYYQRFLRIHPMIESIEYGMVSYDRGLAKSIATSKGTIHLMMELDGKKSFDMTFKHTIRYDAKILKEGLIASIDTRVQKSPNIDKESAKLVDNLEMTMLIRKDNSFDHRIQLNTTRLSSDRDELTIRGITIENRGNLHEAKDGFGKSVIHMNGIKNTSDFDMLPTGLVCEHLPNGDFSISSTAPLVLNDYAFSFTLDEFKASGNLIYDKKYDIMLGHSNYLLNGLIVESSAFPLSIVLPSIKMGEATTIIDDILSKIGSVTITPEADLVAALTNGLIDVSQSRLSYRLENIPASVLEDYQEIIRDTFTSMDSGEDLEMQMQHNFQQLFKKIKDKSGKLETNLDISGNQAAWKFKNKIQFKPKSNIRISDLSMKPEAWAKLFNINVDVSVPIATIQQLGWQALEGSFLKKVRDTYQMHIESDDGDLLINNKKFPFD